MTIAFDVKDANGNVTNHWEGDSADLGNQWVEDNKAAFPEGFTVVQTDVTQARADEVAIAQGLKFQGIGARAIAMLTSINLDKKMTAEQLVAMASNQQLMLAITLVGNGALKTGRDLFLANLGTFYTADEAARIVKPINDSGLV